MSPLSIFLTISVIVLIVCLVKMLMKDSTTLQDSLKNGKNMSTIELTDEASSNFAYSVWFYVNDWSYRYGEPKVIFGRMAGSSGTDNGSIPGVRGLGPCPAAVLGPYENNVTVSLTCYGGIVDPSDNVVDPSNNDFIVHKCSVANVPIQKWVNLIVSVYGRTMDLYIDGKLVKTCLLPGTAKVNGNSSVYLTPNGGFDGWTSKLAYFPKQLNPQDAWNIYTKGPTSWLSSLFTYQVQVSLVENGETQNSITF
jgi:hypothetical protein